MKRRDSFRFLFFPFSEPGYVVWVYGIINICLVITHKKKRPLKCVMLGIPTT